MATDALADGVEPPPAQVQRLRDALSGHVRRLVDVVSQEFADAAPGPLRDVVTKTLGLAEGILTHPVRGSVLDLLAMPPVVRLLTLMHEEPEVFGAAPEHPALEGWGTRDAV
ncbi:MULTISPECIES: DUF6415 family natural product biosynthesis protein [unclassified Streptomyces]|uniref:DUF6415 family natural product biosynthesis protein n=1 Tax=unclassified Streptomyces TaxID=2593676 RepID=UPI0020242A80|nr:MULTISPECIES: DUF6415 family natural product biosynthesis protein [unclassified Streptomyces]MCX4550640.1 DUF6415 family natural product biosynthesis protein [Streptomyces sp. NBC_01500]WSC22084.1 DUF6415 family natural product biosynthesis protein [Streptomyces sp. NBC_01766]